MSHFSLAVIHHKDDILENLLAPFDENKIVSWVQTKEEHIARVRQDIKDYKNGIYKKYCNDKEAYKKEHQNERHIDYLENQFPKRLNWDDEECFKSAVEYYKDEDINEDGSTDETYNTESKWDWWVVGGRWKNMILTKSGQKVDSCFVKDIDFETIREEALKNNANNWERFHEEIKEKPQDETMLRYSFDIAPEESKEQYVNKNISFGTYSLLKDGIWHDKGEMMMFGMDRNVDENWDEKFNSLIAAANENLMITIVDCHI